MLIASHFYDKFIKLMNFLELFNIAFTILMTSASGVRRKFSWGVHSVAYQLCLVRAVCDITIRRHIHVSKPTFWQSLLT